MKKEFWFVSFTILILSCNQIEINSALTDKHKYVHSTNSLIKPPSNFKKATTINGFSDIEEKWNLSVNNSEKSLKTLNETYSEKNLKKQKRRLVSDEAINYKDSLNGHFFEYTSSKKNKTNGKYNMILVIDRIENRQVIKAWFSEYNYDACYQKLKKSMLSTYLCNESEKEEFIKSAEAPDKSTNVYKNVFGKFKYAGELNKNYYYTKDGKLPTESVDSATIYFKPIWNMIPSQAIPKMMEEMLGENYTVIDKDVRKRYGNKNSEVWTAKNKSNTKLGYGGIYWKKNINYVRGSCTDSLESNLKEFKKLMEKIEMK